jgi:hypothetical protein
MAAVNGRGLALSMRALNGGKRAGKRRREHAGKESDEMLVLTFV